MYTIQSWQSTGQYYNYKNKYKIFFQDVGKGEVLILLHGFPTASWDWYKILPTLQKQFRVLAADFIGFGLSAKPKSYKYSLMDQADLVEEILRKHKINSYHILAHDYGDTVAQELLARFAARQNENNNELVIKSVVLLNGGIFPNAHRPLPIQKALMSPVGVLLTPFLNKAKLRKSFQRIFGKETQPTEKEIDEFYSLIERENGKYIFHKLIRYMGERVTHQHRWLTALKDSTVPIRLINGVVDPISGRQMADHYEEVISNPDVIRLEKIGHYPQTEAPNEVLKYFFDFHQRVSS